MVAPGDRGSRRALRRGEQLRPGHSRARRAERVVLASRAPGGPAGDPDALHSDRNLRALASDRGAGQHLRGRRVRHGPDAPRLPDLRRNPGQGVLSPLARAIARGAGGCRRPARPRGVTPRARLVGINHVALEVGDLEEALSFYGRLLAIELRGRVPGMAFIEMGDQFVALSEGG